MGVTTQSTWGFRYGAAATTKLLARQLWARRSRQTRFRASKKCIPSTWMQMRCMRPARSRPFTSYSRQLEPQRSQKDSWENLHTLLLQTGIPQTMSNYGTTTYLPLQAQGNQARAAAPEWAVKVQRRFPISCLVARARDFRLKAVCPLCVKKRQVCALYFFIVG